MRCCVCVEYVCAEDAVLDVGKYIIEDLSGLVGAAVAEEAHDEEARHVLLLLECATDACNQCRRVIGTAHPHTRTHAHMHHTAPTAR